jgi:hypothetical protein
MRRLFVLALVLVACRTQPAAEQSVNERRPPAPGQCDAPGDALPIAPIVLQTSGGGEPVQFAVETDGAVRSRRRVVGRIAGACLLDGKGGVVRSVGAQGVVLGEDREAVAGFRSGASWEDLRGLPVQGEVLVGPDGALGLTPDGNLFLASHDHPALSLPAGATGSAKSSRTALLLYSACGLLDVPDP